MAAIVRYSEAAGETAEDFLFFTGLEVVKLTDSLMRMRGEITGDAFNGETLIVKIYGAFDTSSYEVLSVSKMTFLAAGTSVMGISFRPDLPDFGASFNAAFSAGFKQVGNSFANYLLGDRGADTVFGGAGNDRLIGLQGNDRLFGEGGNDRLEGRSGNDKLVGGDGSDRLMGNGGDDTILGGAGRDKIFGHTGADMLFGGDNLDYFFFRSSSEAGFGAARDVIGDFETGLDLIDLSRIDATTAVGNGTFTFIGADPFASVSGQLRYADGIIQGDINGDGAADFEIEIAGAVALTESDFVL